MFFNSRDTVTGSQQAVQENYRAPHQRDGRKKAHSYFKLTQFCAFIVVYFSDKAIHSVLKLWEKSKLHLVIRDLISHNFTLNWYIAI